MTSKQNWTFDIDRLSEAIHGLEKCLECTICLELMKIPVKTRCGHSFCQKCIGRVLRRNAFCPLCKEPLNKRSISKDDHLESCIQKFENLKIVIQTDSHIDVMSHLKLPRDTKESCSNSGSSQSSVSHKRKQTRRELIRSNQGTSKTDIPSTSGKMIIDCDNPQYEANLTIQSECDQTLTLADVHSLPIDSNDNMFYNTTDVKVRTWIHTLIDNTSGATTKDIEDETRSSKNTYQADQVKTRRRQSSDTKKTDSDSKKLKYNEIHAKVRKKDCKSSADAGKSDSFRDGSSLAMSSDRTHQVDASDRSISHAINESTLGDKPSSADVTWSRVKEIGKEMRGKKKKKKVKKLNVSTTKNSEKYNENIEKNNEKHTKKAPNKNAPRIIEDIILSPRRTYESVNKNAGDNDTSIKETNVPNRSQESNNRKQDAIDNKSDCLSGTEIRAEATASAIAARNRDESFTSDKDDFSMSEANSHLMETSLVITLAEGNKLRIKNLNSCQMNEIIGFKGNSKELIDDANIQDQRRSLMEEDKEQEEDVGIITDHNESFDSPHRRRLIILTPEKLNESVGKRSASHDSGSRTPVSKLVNPTSCLPSESRISHVNNDTENITTTIPGERASQLQTPNRLSLRRNPKILGSPSFSQIPLMERLLINELYLTSSKHRNNVDSSVSINGPSSDRLMSVRRDLNSQINGEDCSPNNQATTAISTCSKSTVMVENNNRDVGGTVCQDERFSVELTRSRKSRHIDNRAREEGCSFPVKFTQLGTLIKRRDVKYYYQGATKREQCLPAKIRVTSVYNMQQSANKDEIAHYAGNKLRNYEFSLIPLNDSQDSINVTVIENVHYVHKSAACLDNTVLEATRLTHGVPASSTPKADADRRLDRAETTARGSSSTSVINRLSIAKEAPRSPRTSHADHNATQQGTLQVHSHTTNSMRLLSPEKDSQLRFLSIDSPMSQHGQSRLANSARPMQSELERVSTSVGNNNLTEMKDSQRAVKILELPSKSSRQKPNKKRKRNDNDDDDNDDDDDSSVSAISVSSQCTLKLDNNEEEHEIQNKTSSYSNADKKRCLSLSRDRGDEVICLDPDDRRKADERTFKRIVSISDSDSESESPVRVTKKLNRNKSGDRCDPGNASITSTSKRRKSPKTISDEDLRIRSIVNKWSNEHNAAQKRLIEGRRSAQDIVKPARLVYEEKTTDGRLSLSINSSEGEKRSSARLSEKNTESDLFFESNSAFNSEGLAQLATRQSGDKSSKKEQESPSSMDLMADDIINKVLQMNRSQQNNLSARRSAGVVSQTNDNEASQKDKNEHSEYNLLQDNFDEVIANVELPQSEDVIPCSEVPAHRNPDRNLNRTLTEQNMSSCPAMTNESRDVTRHGQMKLVSSTADVFEYCGYSAGKTTKKTPPTSGNSDKENTVSYGQRKHDHIEEDRRDKKNIAAADKVGREMIVSKNNISQEMRRSFDRVETTERTSRIEKEVPAGSTSRADVDGESNTKDLSSENDSLMNITLYQARLKMIEEDLFGVAPGRVATKTSKKCLDDSFREEQRTPKKRKRGAHEKNALSQEHSADEDDIVENTPEKMRNSGKTIDLSKLRNIMTLNLSPIPSFCERTSSSITPRQRAPSKSELASTRLCRLNLMYPLYQSTPKVTSTSAATTSRRDDDVSTTTSNKGQFDKQRTTISGAVSSSTKWAADGNTLGNMCRQSDRGKLRFVCTGLTAAQLANVQRFARLHNVDYARQFDPNVTHVIVNTVGAENAAKSTLKYLQGIAYCKWVVSYKWIEDCTNERMLLPELPYEATTQSADISGPGPRNSRLSHRNLFEDFTFLCIGPYDNVSLSQYQDLLRATGATVVNSLEALAAEKKSLRGVVIQGDTHENSTIESWYRDARAAPILIDWIVECIGHYRLFQLIPYIQTLSPQDYCAIGYPREIVGEEEYSDVSG